MQDYARTITQGLFRCWARCSERCHSTLERDDCQRSYFEKNEEKRDESFERYKMIQNEENSEIGGPDETPCRYER